MVVVAVVVVVVAVVVVAVVVGVMVGVVEGVFAVVVYWLQIDRSGSVGPANPSQSRTFSENRVQKC